MSKDTSEETVLTIKLQKGLADRNRLPLAHVLSVLEEIRQVVTEVGRRIQRERGAADKSGDFGLEIIANESGNMFRRGSVQTPLAITSNISTGILAVQEIIRTLDMLEREDGVPDPNAKLDRTIIRRLSRISAIQRRDKLELEMSVQSPGFPEPMKATFGVAGMASVKALQSPTFVIEDVAIFGKLVELVDRDKAEEERSGFWGELRTDVADVWRVQFKQSELENVTPLFRKQVIVTGTAVYYRVATPKLIAKTVLPDADRDYVSAFDELFGCYREAFNSDTKALIKKMREEG